MSTATGAALGKAAASNPGRRYAPVVGGQRHAVDQRYGDLVGSARSAERPIPTTILRRSLGEAPPPPVRTPLSSGRPHTLLRRHRVVVAPHRGYSGGPARDADDDTGLVVPACTAVPLVFTIDDSAHRPGAFVHGAHAEHSSLPGPCAPLYVEAWLAPLAAARILGVPMHHLTDGTVDLAALSGPQGSTVRERVRETPDWAVRYALIDEFLLDRWEQGPEVPAEVREAWQRLVARNGNIPIAEVAREVGWSHKHLITRFNEWVGVSPKKAARILRFEAFTRALDTRPHPTWSDLATRFGYADQAHLIRETRALTGHTPTSLVSAGAG